MAKYLPLPSGAYFKVDDDVSYTEAISLAQKEYPEAFLTPAEREERQGFGAAVGTSFKQAKAATESGLGALLNSQTLKDWAKQDEEEAAKTAFIPTTSEDLDKALKQGLLPGAGAALSKYVTEPVGGIVGRYGVPTAVGAIAAPVASVAGAGTVAAGAIGSAAMLLADWPAEIGENLQRQKEQGKEEDVQAATISGLGQAALASFGIPGMGALPKVARGIFTKEVNALGKEVIAGKITKEAAASQLSSTLRNVLVESGVNAVTGTGLMVGTEALRRAQAGQNVFDEEALKEYGQQALGAAELAPIFGALHGVPRRGAEKRAIEKAAAERAEIDRKVRVAEEDRIAAEQADKLQEMQLQTAQQATFGAPERPAEGVVGKTGDLFGETTVAEPLKQAVPETRTVAEREAAAVAAEQPTPAQDLHQRQAVLKQTFTELQDRVAKAAAAGDLENISALSGQLKTVQAAIEENKTALKKAVPIEQMPEVQAAQLRGQLAKKTAELKKAGDLGDFEKIQKLAGDITQINAELEKLPTGPDLVEQAAINKAKDVAIEGERRAQEQADLFAQVQKPTKGEMLNAEAISKYQEGLKQLEEAHAAGADQRIIDELVDKLRASAVEKDLAKAKTGAPSVEKLEQQGERVARITRAIKEAEAAGDVQTAEALKKRLAEAKTETAQGKPEDKRNKALEDQAAHIEELRSAVEDLKAGRHFGGKDVATAASTREGLELQAKEAAGKYVDAALRDINAVREENGHKLLTNDEALKLALDLRSHISNAIVNRNTTALKVVGEKGISNLEKQLAQIKQRYAKGETRYQKGPELLKRERDVLAMLKAEREKKKPDARKIAMLEREVKAIKEQEARLEAERAKAEAKEPAGVNPDQRSLFEEKDLAPLATVRSTPEKFMKFLGSATLRKLKERLVNLDKAVEKAPENKNLIAERDKTKLQVEEQIRAKANEEQKALERQAELPTKGQRVVATNVKLPGGEEVVKRKQIITKEAPKTAAEKKAEAQKRAEAGAKERIEDKQRQAARLEAGESQKLEDVKKVESKLKSQLSKVQAEIRKDVKEVSTLEKAVAAAKTTKGKKHWQDKLDALNSRIEAKELAKTQESLKKELDKLAKTGAGVERILAIKENEPARTERQKPLKTGTVEAAKERAAKKLEEDYKEAMRRAKEGNEDYYNGPSGNTYRVTDVNAKVIDKAEGQKTFDSLKLPKDVKVTYVHSFADLPAKELADLARDGIVPGTPEARAAKAFVNNKGEVFVVGEHHATAKDIQESVAHELIGHVGVDRILGEKGMAALAKRVYDAHGGIEGLAKKLGVEEAVKGTMADYALRIEKMTKEGASKAEIEKMLKIGETQAVRELIAHTAEQKVSASFKEKASQWIKELVGAVRNWLRENGFAELSKASTSDIYYLLKRSQRNYDKGEMGAHRDVNGNISFRNKVSYNESFDPSLRDTASKVIAQEKSWSDRIKGVALGMEFMHRFTDRFAGLEYMARTMKDKLEGVQMMYWNRLYDQRNNMMAEIATHGPVGIEKDVKHNTYQYKSKNVASLKDVMQEVGKAAKDIGNSEAALEQFGLYLAAEKALVVGKEKLNFDPKITDKMLADSIKFGRGNAHFQEARKLYKEYNNGMIDFLAESGAISKEKAKELKDRGDYVAYYREKDGHIIDEENNLTIGSLKNQAYLKELLGGDKSIVNFETGALQNTHMLTDMAMRNVATKNTAHTLKTLGIAEIRKGDGPAAPNVIRFYENGEKMHAVLETKGMAATLENRLAQMREAGRANTPEYKKLREQAENARVSEGIYGDIPAELIVKGMEGISMTLPAAIGFLRGPANLLRKSVTRNPAYAMRVAFKDSLSSWMISGADTKPVISTLKHIKESWKGESPDVRKLQEQGIVGGHVFAGTMSDMQTIANQMARGQTGWEKLWAKADRLAIIADESARLTLYNGFIKKGMSPMEASLATLEAQNFTKHGYSPSIRALSVMIPFFNAQIQGLNTFARAGLGKSLFEDKLGVKASFMKRGAAVAGMTMLYAALMQNNEAYKNATETDKLNYWFIPLPFFKEPIRVPIPFEAGTVFKAVPEAMYNLAATDAKSKDVLPALSRQVIGNIPGVGSAFLPQGVKPLVEGLTNTDLFTLNKIESSRQLAEKAGYRANTNTTEFSKTVGKALGISPIQIDHLVNGYTSSTGVALLSMFNPVLGDRTAPESKTSQLPVIGGFFQPTDGSGLVNKAYENMLKVEQANATYKRLQEEDSPEADKFYRKFMADIDQASAAGSFKQQMGVLNKQERTILADKSLTPAQKRKQLDEIKQDKIQLARDFNARG